MADILIKLLGIMTIAYGAAFFGITGAFIGIIIAIFFLRYYKSKETEEPKADTLIRVFLAIITTTYGAAWGITGAFIGFAVAILILRYYKTKEDKESKAVTTVVNTATSIWIIFLCVSFVSLLIIVSLFKDPSL